MSDPVQMLGARIAQRATSGAPSTTGTVTGVQSAPAAVWVSGVAGTAGSKSMPFTRGFQRSWAEYGDQIVGQLVKVSFLDDGQPVVDDVIVKGS